MKKAVIVIISLNAERNTYPDIASKYKENYHFSIQRQHKLAKGMSMIFDLEIVLRCNKWISVFADRTKDFV